ncbi:MAG: hypothetical protein AAFQ87_23205 [Bacteroidota bacterium]
MKKRSFFSLLFLCLGFSSLLAQENEKPYRNDLSLSLSTVQLAKSPFYAVLFNPRLMYRRHYGAWALRVQAEGLQHERQDFPGYSFQQSLSLSGGLQYTVHKGRWSGYGFMDVGFGHMELQKTIINRWTLSGFEEIRGLKTTAGLGVAFRFAERWQLGLESGISFWYGQGNSTPGGVDTFDQVLIGPNEGWISQWLINPVNAFWISYAFGQNKP